ncbi:dipeptidase [Thermaerobacillus caldiproteolyticus]|uniref:Membrane dipeptidase n=1 Tax=Thermaerobacillus caldiproteolyticus TaxID=247480 RepID=A0A7V9Z9Q7_9BACL|nr:dipeptidase [Anoxybacillus caldiproteolyticus]MBA2876570.1 membrane dipeptidase [Anoxybacillus caldiproteolyticus]
MIFDAHCDALMKLWMDRTLSFQDGKSLHVTFQSLVEAKTKVQCFAIYIPENVPEEARFTAALEMIDIFFEQIINRFPNMKFVQSKREIKALADNEIGAMLTLEGCEAIGTNLAKLKTLLRLGVSSVGLTWNWANSVADGAWEQRGAGLTRFGKQVVTQLNEANCWVDVSHLSEKAFWDVLEMARFPIASHSNTYALCPHPRNLRDEQIRALIHKNGMIGITFVPYFVKKEKEKATISDVLRHLEHVCSLGGEYHVGFGSDFDGIEETVAGLENVRCYENLVNELQKHYSETEVERFLFWNFYEHLPR